MRVQWTTDEGEVYRAERPVEARGMIHLQVESLGHSGWDWHVWESSGLGQQRYGLEDSLEDAQAKAENASAALAQELSQARPRLTA